jgi:hypothetical protein
MSILDSGGRIADRAAVAALAWTPGTELHLDAATPPGAVPTWLSSSSGRTPRRSSSSRAAATSAGSFPLVVALVGIAVWRLVGIVVIAPFLRHRRSRPGC